MKTYYVDIAGVARTPHLANSFTVVDGVLYLLDSEDQKLTDAPVVYRTWDRLTEKR